MLFCGRCDMDEQFGLGIDLMIRGLDCENDDSGCCCPGRPADAQHLWGKGRTQPLLIPPGSGWLPAFLLLAGMPAGPRIKLGEPGSLVGVSAVSMLTVQGARDGHSGCPR